jgi:hypothetical protein
MKSTLRLSSRSSALSWVSLGQRHPALPEGLFLFGLEAGALGFLERGDEGQHVFGGGLLIHASQVGIAFFLIFRGHIVEDIIAVVIGIGHRNLLGRAVALCLCSMTIF